MSVDLPQRAWPTAGAAAAAGLLTAECLFTVRPLMDGFGAGGVWAPLLGAGLAYLGIGVAVDLAWQRVGPRAWRTPAIARGAVVLGFGATVAVASGQVVGAVLAAFLAAAVWTALAHHHWLWVLAAATSLYGLAPALPRLAPPPAVPIVAPATGPSIALVVLDTVRLDRTSLARDDRDTTPHLAALAATGVRFDRAYSTSCWSLPAHASLLTGRLPVAHGAHYEHLALDPSVPTLPALLASAGYETAGFSANPLVAPGTGLARGFSTFEEPWRGYTLREALLAWRVWTRLAAPDRDKGGAAVVQGVADWATGRPTDRPFFVLVNLMEAHVPYQEVPVAHRRAWTDPTLSLGQLEAIGERSHMAQVFGTSVAAADRATTLDLLDGATRAADAYLGQVHEILGDDVLWFVVSDHGELIGEHDLWGHNLGLYEPLLRVPLVVSGPGVRAGAQVDAAVSLVDVFPTVLGLAGISEVPAHQGVDLGPALASPVVSAPRTVRAEHLRTDFLTAGWQALRPFGDHAALRARRATAVQGTTKRVVAEDGTDLGYDLAADPGEAAPFSGAETGLEAQVPAPTLAGPVAPFEPAQAEALRALGYVR